MDGDIPSLEIQRLVEGDAVPVGRHILRGGIRRHYVECGERGEPHRLIARGDFTPV